MHTILVKTDEPPEMGFISIETLITGGMNRSLSKSIRLEKDGMETGMIEISGVENTRTVTGGLYAFPKYPLTVILYNVLLRGIT